MSRSNFGAVRLPLLAAAVLASFAVPISAQIVEKERTFSDLTATHPCDSGFSDRNAIVTDCQSATDIGGGGGAVRCFAHCDGSAPWEAVSIGGGAGGGPADALASAVVIEGATADGFEGNFTFADPTADWTWAWGATGTLSAGGNLIAATDNTYDIGGSTSTFRFRNLYLSGNIESVANIGSNSSNFWVRTSADVRLGPIPITWGGTNAESTDTTIQRTAAGIVKFTNSLQLTPIASPPRTCDATAEGDIYADTSHAFCFCDGTTWQKLVGAGTCA